MICLIHGVHGDETRYTQYVSYLLCAYLRNFLSVDIYSIGPIFEQSSQKEHHFLDDMTDPNRSHSASWPLIHKPSLEIAYTIYKKSISDTVFDVQKYVSTIKKMGCNTFDVFRNPQSRYNDFFGYVSRMNWNLSKDRRSSILQYIYSNESCIIPEKDTVFIDIHSGIGQSSDMQIVEVVKKRNGRIDQEGCTLIHGLVRDVKYQNAVGIVVEVGTIGTNLMMEQVINELKSRSTLIEHKIEHSVPETWWAKTKDNVGILARSIQSNMTS